MKKNATRKILLAVLFAVPLACCLLIGVAAAPTDDTTAVTDGYVARIGDESTGTYYATLADAIAAAPENGTVTMIADTALDASLNLTKSITLAGKGVISTSAAKAHTIILAGNVHLTVTDHVEIKATGSGAFAIYQTAAAATEVTLTGNAKVTSSGSYAIYYVGGKNNNKTVKVTISESAAVSGTNGIKVYKNLLLNLTMTGGTIDITSGDAICIDSTAAGTSEISISGGTISGGTKGRVMYISAGTVNVTLTGSIATYATKSTTPIFLTDGGAVTFVVNADIKTANKVIFRANYGTQNITINGGTLDAGNNNIILNASSNTATAVGNAVTLVTITNGSLTTTGTAIRVHRGGLNITMTGGSISAGINCVEIQGATVTGLPDNDCDSTLTFTGGTLTSEGNNSGYIFNLGNTCGVQHFRMEWGGTAKATAANADNGYFIVLSGNTLLDLKITGGTVTTKRASIHLNSQILPTAERPFPAIIEMSGGSITSGDVVLNIKNTCLVDFTMTGGTLTNKNVDSAVIRNDDVINADTDLIYASRITIGEKATLVGKGVWILVQNGAMDITLQGNRVYNAYNGMIRISGGKSGYASTIIVEGGICVQPITSGGYVFYNGNKNASFSFPHGFSAYGGRSMIINFGNGPATTLPGSAPDSIYTIGAPVMNSGASVRMVPGSNGLRFISHIDAATVAQILSVADAGTVSYGTLIFPASYLNGLSYYTHDTITKYLDIEAKNGLIADGEGGYNIRAAIVNIKEENYDREFVAIAYAKYETDGATHYRYSAMQILETSRNIRQLAAAALADTSATKTGAYVYPVSGGYSRYTDAQREVLNSYVPAALKDLDLFLITGQSNGSGYSNISNEFRTDHPEYVNGFSNVLYSGYACTGSGTGNPFRWGTLIPVPTTTGFGRSTNHIGAELGLAEMLSNVYNSETGRTAAILKYADGGTYLSDNVGGSSVRQGNWTPPSYLEEHGKTDEILSGNLYRNFITLAEQTVAYYRAHGYNVNASGMFWMQGENERNYYNRIPALGNEAAVTSPAVEQVNALYTTLFKTLVTDARKDIGNILGKDASAMPVIAGSISEAFGTTQSANQTNFVKMQAKMVSETEHTYILSATRYLVTGTDSSDTAHYSADDMVFAGNRLGAMFLTLYGEEAAIPSPAESDYVAEVFVGGVSQGKYTNLGYAINTAPDNATVKLLRDVTLYGPLNIATFRQNVVVDGNGFTVHSYSNGHAMKVIGKSTNITLHNFRLINHRDDVDDAYGIYLYEGPTLNITGDNSYIEAYRRGIVIELASTVNISGGTFTTRLGDSLNAAPVFMKSASTLNISGGTFKGFNAGAAIYLGAIDCTATITGGPFKGGDTAKYAIYSYATGTVLNISGATITKGTTGSVYNKNTSAGTQTY